MLFCVSVRINLPKQLRVNLIVHISYTTAYISNPNATTSMIISIFPSKFTRLICEIQYQGPCNKLQSKSNHVIKVKRFSKASENVHHSK